MRKGLLRAAVALLFAAAFLTGVVLLTGWARDRLGEHDRFLADFADIQCGPPPGQSREDFLGEVQYLGEFPDRISLLDPRLPQRLAGAFHNHPWVAKVERVEVVPRRKVQVELRYRVGVLAVIQGQEKRVLDATGVLLPATASSAGLPAYLGRLTTPPGPPGSPWGDPTLLAAARTVGFLAELQDRFHFSRVEGSANDLVLKTVAGSRVSWGHAPGDERASEARAVQKREYLVRYCEDNKDLDNPHSPCEHDVRPLSPPLVKPLR
jgi:hypothetical protein